MLRRVLEIGVVLGAGALTGCLGGGVERVGGKAPAESRVLTLLDPFSNRMETIALVDEVARLSHGTLRIRVVPAGHDGPDFEAATIRDLQQGRADLGYAASRAWDEFGARRLRALGAPLLIDSYGLQERVLSSDVVGPMLDELRPLHLVGLGILPGPIRRPLGFGRPVTAPGELRGLTIGTQQSRVADATLRALGALPRRLPVADVQDRLDGLDGIEQRVAAIESDRLDPEGSRLAANVDLWPRPIVIAANAGAYDRLTDDQRRILRTAAANVVMAKTTAERGLEAETAGSLCRRGHIRFDSATPAELRAWRRAVEPVYHDLRRDPGTREALEAIERLKQELGVPPSEVRACKRPATAPGTGAATALDGVWSMDTDPEAARPDGLDENWGRWIFVFDRGRFASTQENPTSCTWGYGTFIVDGNRMAWEFSDGGGIAPNNAENRGGEYFVFGFSAYRDTLTVTPVKGEISPLNFRAEPWRRRAATPSRRFFSTRCPPPAEALPD